MNRMLRLMMGTMMLACLPAGGAVAQTPDVVQVVVPDGGSSLQSTDLSGSLTDGQFTCTWTVGSNSAVFNFTEAFHSTIYVHPMIRLNWLDVSAPLPMHVAVTSSGPGVYAFVGEYTDPQVGWISIYEPVLSGDWEFGQEWGVCDEVQLEFALDSMDVVYDLQIAIEWGPGVAVEPATWGTIKAIYR